MPAPTSWSGLFLCSNKPHILYTNWLTKRPFSDIFLSRNLATTSIETAVYVNQAHVQSGPQSSQSGTITRVSTPKTSAGEMAAPAVYVTRNTEYHFRDGIVVRVVDRRSRIEDRQHQALGLSLLTRVRRNSDDSFDPLAGLPEIGNHLCFMSPYPNPRQIITSPVIEIRKPANLAAVA